MKDTLLRIAAPSALDMLQADHEHVTMMFHEYRADAPARQRTTVVRCIAVAIEVHSLLEEEIFYPALRAVTAAPDVLDRGEADQRAAYAMLQQLRVRDTTDVEHDAQFLQVMRAIFHHVAEEETVLMPEARVLLRSRLHDLGATMARRRLELLAPRTAELLSNAVGSVPAAFGVFAGGAMAGASMAFRHVFAR